MVERKNCSKCGGLGKLCTLDEPPADLTSSEGWEECPRCKGTGVEMSDEWFEVYFVFNDEVDAREWMENAPDSVTTWGIRRLDEPPPSILDR